MDLKVSVDVNFQTVIVTLFRCRFFFILISLSTNVPLLIHTKLQPNMQSHCGVKVDFNGFGFLVSAAILESRPR